MLKGTTALWLSSRITVLSAKGSAGGYVKYLHWALIAESLHLSFKYLLNWTATKTFGPVQGWTWLALIAFEYFPSQSLKAAVLHASASFRQSYSLEFSI